MRNKKASVIVVTALIAILVLLLIKWTIEAEQLENRKAGLLDRIPTQNSTIQTEETNKNKLDNILNSTIQADKLKIANNKENSRKMFIGDSRFVGINKTCNVTSQPNTEIVAEVGKGYDWFMSKAIYNINDSDILILGLGVNDLYNIERYIETYKDLSKNHEIYIISVNPIEYHDSITNDMIESFNDKIKSELLNIDSIHYIDTYNYLVNKGYSTIDGLHYTNDTYERIYEFIMKELGE